MSGSYCPTHDVHDDPDAAYHRRWRVYYCYAADGTCLYVGVTDDIRTRIQWHALYNESSFAWIGHCARVDGSDEFQCRYEAHAFEVAEIGRLRPAFNRHHNPNPTRWVAPTERRAS